MSLWGVHIGLAATVTAIALALAVPGWSPMRRGAVVAASGAWAVVPDLYHVVPGVRPWYKPLFHDSALADVFWFHRAIDRADPFDSGVLSVGAAVTFVVVAVAIEVWLQDDIAGSD